MLALPAPGLTYLMAAAPARAQPFMTSAQISTSEHADAVAIAGDGHTAITGTASADEATTIFNELGAWMPGQLLETTSGPTPDFGWDVAISADGSTALVSGSAHGLCENAFAWIFARSSEGWIEQAKVGPGGSECLRIGDVALSGDGNTALVGSGAPGTAYIYTREAGNWTQQAVLEHPGGGPAYETPGVAISADGNTVLLGGPFSNGSQATIFRRNGAAWTNSEDLFPKRPYFGGDYAASAALSANGNTALVGDSAEKETSQSPGYEGAARLYALSAGKWEQRGGRLLANNPMCGDEEFGGAVALSSDGKTALVSAPLCSTVWAYLTTGDDAPVQQGNGMPGPGLGQLALTPDGQSALGASWWYRGARTGGLWSLTRTLAAPTEPPAITGLRATGGPEAGGNSIIVNGTHLEDVEAVRFGSTDAESAIVLDPETLRVTPPPGSGTTDVTVQTPAATSPLSSADEYTYYPPPHIAAVSPRAVIEGTEERTVIEGSGLRTASQVSMYYPINGYPKAEGLASIVRATDTELEIAVPRTWHRNPPQEGGELVVTTLGGSTPLHEQFNEGTRRDWLQIVQREPAPTITKLTPKYGTNQGGEQLTIYGKGLAGTLAVTLGGTRLPVLASTPERVFVTTPAHPDGLVDTSITTTTGTTPITTSDRFKFLPTVSSIAPTFGPISGANSVTIHGTGFAAGTRATAVKFGTTRATSVTCPSSTECTAVAPAHAAGTVDIVATTNKVSSQKTTADRYTYQ